MYLREIELDEFRSYRRLRLALEPAGIRLIGPNASGKSSLLEAVAMLATTRSPRSASDREVINWQSGEEIGFPPFARLRAEVTTGYGQVELEIRLQADPSRPTVVKKQIHLGGRTVRAMDAVGALKAVLFSPEDVALISGAPSARRRFLDLTISQLDGAYLRALARYGRVLSQRNGLLKSLVRQRIAADSTAATAQLAFWDGELVAHGSALIARRVLTVARLAALSRERFARLSPGRDLTITYRSSLELNGIGAGAPPRPLDELQAVVAREYGEQLTSSRVDELRRGASLIGPHRDDLVFEVDGVDVAPFGSRGLQRLAVVALKLAETSLMTEEAGEAPVLMLDDVLSELDAPHRRLLTATAAEIDAQVIVTATDDALLEVTDLARLPLARVEQGELTFA